MHAGRGVGEEKYVNDTGDNILYLSVKKLKMVVVQEEEMKNHVTCDLVQSMKTRLHHSSPLKPGHIRCNLA